MFTTYSKLLSKVDLPGNGSHQHEIGIPKGANAVFDNPHRWLPVTYHFFNAAGERQEEVFVTSCYYNTRAGKDRKPEYRLYYPHAIKDQLAEYRKGDNCLFLKDLDRLPHVFLWRNPDLFCPGEAVLSENECIEQAVISQTSYRTVDVSNYISAGPEQVGNKPKRWFSLRGTEGIRALFKEQRPNTVEAATEKICAELAYLLNLPSPLTLLAYDSDRYGILSVAFFMPRADESADFASKRKPNRKSNAFREFNDEREILGSAVLRGAFAEYIENKHAQDNYTVKNIFHALRYFELSEAEVGTMIQYLIFDAYIGNTDRHHDNWSLIASGGKNKSVHLAPTFDHGPSLGGTMTIERRRTLIKNRSLMEKYYRNGRSALYGRDRYLGFVDLVKSSRAEEREIFGTNKYSDKILESIASLRNSDLELILNRVPQTYISALEKESFITYLGVAGEAICTT